MPYRLVAAEYDLGVEVGEAPYKSGGPPPLLPNFADEVAGRAKPLPKAGAGRPARAGETTGSAAVNVDDEDD